MKKLMLIAALLTGVLAPMAYAGNGAICDGSGASKTVAVGDFTKRAFQAKCSQNVFSHYADSSVAFGVVAGSKKGKNYFGGGTGGGGIKAMGTCDTSAGCTTTEINNNNATAAMNAS
mgnify:CR=1 FL=1